MALMCGSCHGSLRSRAGALSVTQADKGPLVDSSALGDMVQVDADKEKKKRERKDRDEAGEKRQKKPKKEKRDKSEKVSCTGKRNSYLLL